jgi:hypothetical protein
MTKVLLRHPRGGVRAWTENDFKDFFKVLMKISAIHTVDIKYKFSKKFHSLAEPWYLKG